MHVYYFTWLYDSTIPETQQYVPPTTLLPRPPSMWCGFDMSNFPPSNFAGATISWLYMPIIFEALGITCKKWTFPLIQLPINWNQWVTAYQEAFQQERQEIFEYVNNHYDTTDQDHIDADAQDYLIHDRYSHVPSVMEANQEMQEWAVQQTYYD